MALEKVRIGVLDIELPLPSQNIMGSMNTVTPVVCSIELDASNSLDNDVNKTISPSDTYQFILALGGEDRVNGGYTVARGSTATAAISPASATSVLRLFVANEDLPANFDEAAFMAVFVKVNNSSKYQLCKLAYIPTDGSDFEVAIRHLPLKSAPAFSATLLQATTADSILGSRSPYGFVFEKVEPTTNTITEAFEVTTVNVDPNNGPSYTVRTTIAAGLQFELLLNDIKSIVRSAGGFALSYSATGGGSITEGEYALATAQAILRGNKPVKVNYPPDGLGNSEVGLYLGLRTQNDQNLSMAWSKSATTPVGINYQAAILDSLLISQHSKLSYVRKSS